MSTSDLYMVFRTTARHLSEYENGNGSAPAIWTILCEDYLHVDRNSWIFAGKARQDLDRLVWDKRVPLTLRLVQSMCRVGAVIQPGDLAEVSDACFEVYEMYKKKEPNFVNHWHKIGSDLKRLSTRKHGRAIGYGLNCISSCDDWIEHIQSKGKYTTMFDCVADAKNDG